MSDTPKNFENSAIRTAWNEQEEEWYFSVVDVVGVLTEQDSPRSASTYWAVLKKRLLEEGAEEGAVQKEMGSPNFFKFTREFKSAKI